MLYTVGEMAKRIGVAPSTLRYYDKEGLLPFVQRSESGVRVFKETDAEWLRVIGCLKRTGMRLRDIKRFVEMAMQGDETIDERLALIVAQRERVTAQLAELEETLHTLEYKEWYYRTAKAHGSTVVPRETPTEQLPEPLRTARERLQNG